MNKEKYEQLLAVKEAEYERDMDQIRMLIDNQNTEYQE